MTEETGLWTWRNLSEERSLTEVTEAHLSRIKTLTVAWNSAENGAAVLADAGFSEIEGLRDHEDKEGFLGALEVFVTTASVPAYEGTIRNRYAKAGKSERWLLEHTPSSEIADQILSGPDIEYAAEPDELTLWRAANKRAWGIDPKRPFGSESVSRDVRELIDPDKKLGNAAFGKRRKWLESRMLLLLQFHVQNGTLAPGLWRRGDDWVWRPVRPDDPPPPGEPLTRRQWADRMYHQNHYENVAYTETIRALTHLVWNNRLIGSYGELVRQFQLANHFDGYLDRPYEGSVEERFRAALAAFPERKGAQAKPWFTLSFARILNAQGRFEEAHAVLEAADLLEIDPKEVDLSSVNHIAVAWAEGLIARYGAGVMSQDEFQSALFGCHSQWRVQPELWGFIWNVLHQRERYRDSEESPGLEHAQAMAAQLELLRGGYDPDGELKHF